MLALVQIQIQQARFCRFSIRSLSPIDHDAVQALEGRLRQPIPRGLRTVSQQQPGDAFGQQWLDLCHVITHLERQDFAMRLYDLEVRWRENQGRILVTALELAAD